MASICTDAGHGGSDTGAVFSEIREKDINLPLVLLLNEELKRRNHLVLTTRKSDTGVPPLMTRCRLINAHWNQASPKFDAIISLHCDVAVATDPQTGTMEPITDRRGFYGIYSQESTPGTALAQSIATAAENQDLTLSHDGTLSTIALGRTLAWIHKTLPPSVLIEMGYLTNAEDRQLLLDSTFRRTVVTAIADGVEDFVNNR